MFSSLVTGIPCPKSFLLITSHPYGLFVSLFPLNSISLSPCQGDFFDNKLHLLFNLFTRITGPNKTNRNCVRMLSLSPFHRWENWTPETLGYLPVIANKQQNQYWGLRSLGLETTLLSFALCCPPWQQNEKAKMEGRESAIGNDKNWKTA